MLLLFNKTPFLYCVIKQNIEHEIGDRTVYRTKTEQGENAYIYLLDEAMQMDKIGLISTNLAEKIAMTVTESPYRVTAKRIKNFAVPLRNIQMD